MKKNLSLLLLGIGLVVGALCFAGCGTSGGLFTETKTVSPVVRETIRTNEVAQVVTDQSGVPIATNVHFEISRQLETNFVTNVTYAVNEKADGYIETAKTINGVVPTPWTAFINYGLIALSAILGLVAKVKSDKANILPAIIAGVEAAGHPETKQSIANQARISGVEDKLRPLVAKLTS